MVNPPLCIPKCGGAYVFTARQDLSLRYPAF